MFDIKEFNNFLENIGDVGKKEARKKIYKTFKNKDFTDFLFKPEKGKNIADDVSRMYDMMSHPRVLKCIDDTLDEYDYEFSRDIAVLMQSLYNICMDTIVAKTNKSVADKNNATITINQHKDNMKKITKYKEAVEKILSDAKSIIGTRSKTLKKSTGLPKQLCTMAYLNVPQSLEKFRMGVFLKVVLENIYVYVNDNPAKIDFDDKIRWGTYFKDVFGKDNIYDVATFILLEGVNKISQLPNKAVRECWDSLTDFALNTLEDANDNTRTQMTELYLKRIEKMFANNKFELRANLLEISKNRFPRLSETITRYKEKLETIINK